MNARLAVRLDRRRHGPRRATMRCVSDLLAQCAELPRRRSDAGTTIIEQGEVGGTIFVLVEGTVCIERDDTVLADARHARRA